MKRRDWVKVHLMCGTTTNIVTAMDVTAKHFHLEEVVADKAYLSKGNLEHDAKWSAMPYIPFKANTSMERSRMPLWDTLYYYFVWRREDFLERYHMRSMVESTFAMIKARFGDALRSKTDVTQRNESLCKVLCHNLCALIQSGDRTGMVTSRMLLRKPDATIFE